MMLPGMDGLDLVSRIQRIDPNLPVLVVTRMNAVSLAVDAMRRGAFDYVMKPSMQRIWGATSSGDSNL